MEHGIVLFVCRLVSEEVSVRTCLEILSIALLGLLSDGKRNGTGRVLFLYLTNQVTYLVICEERVFPALKDKYLYGACETVDGVRI
jgi:hypothetical protein